LPLRVQFYLEVITNMGTYASGILVYGVDLGGGDGEFLVAETDAYGALTVPWYVETDEDDNFVEHIEETLLSAHNFPEEHFPGADHQEHVGAAKAAMGVHVAYCGQDTYTTYLLVTYEEAASGAGVVSVDFAELEQRRVREDWDGKLAHALELLGLTPNDPQPKWLLTSYYG
jgi:hypothetical protein